MQKVMIVIFSRPPILGRVKKRLAKDIGDVAALKLHQQLFSNTLAITKLSGLPSKIYLAEQPGGPFEGKWTLQHGADLGERMRNAFTMELKNNHRVCLIGSDCQDLQSEDLIEAMSALDKTDLVLGPAHDGGYYLIGMRQTLPELFNGISWGTSKVLRETLARAKSLNLKIHLLQVRHDLDTKNDLPPNLKF